jgi:hypothetical protein
MIGAEHFLAYAEGLAMHRFRFRQLALQVAHVAQVGQPGGGECVFRPQRAQINAQHAVVQRFSFIQLSLRSQRFGARQQLLRVVALLRRSRCGGSRCGIAGDLPGLRCRGARRARLRALIDRCAGRRRRAASTACTGCQRRIGAELALAVQHAAEVGQRRRRVRMIVALRLGQDGVRATQQEFGAGVIGLAFQHQRQIVQGRSGIDGIRTRAPLVDFQRQTKQRLGIGIASLLEQRAAQNGITGRQIRVTFAEDPPGFIDRFATGTFGASEVPLLQRIVGLIGQGTPT